MDLTYALVVGAVLPFILAVIAKTSWSSNRKRWAQILLAAITVALGVLFKHQPQAWEVIARELIVIVGVAQMVYAVLKPTGALGWLEALGSPAEPDPEPERAL